MKKNNLKFEIVKDFDKYVNQYKVIDTLEGRVVYRGSKEGCECWVSDHTNINRQDLQFTTFEVGMYPHGSIVHYPTGEFVIWETNKEQSSQWRAREAALEKLQKLVKQHGNNRQTSER